MTVRPPRPAALGRVSIGEPIRMPPDVRPRNLLDVVHRAVAARPEAEALRWRSAPSGHVAGEWESLAYGALWERVASVSLALGELGVRGGDRVVILSRSRPEWVVADLATLALGAVACPIYPGEPATRIAAVVRGTGARLAFVESEPLLRRLQEGLGRASMPRVVLFDGGARTGPPLLAELAARPASGAEREAWDEGWRGIETDALATIAHTLGEDGEPLGAMLTHRNVIHNLYAAVQALDVRASDIGLSVLPMSHMLERGAGVYVLLGVGGTVVFAERRMERWAANMAEVAPTIMVCVPRFFEHIERRIRADVTAAGPAARALVRLTRRLGRASYRRRAAGLPEPAWLRLSLGLARALVASGVRRATGGRLRFFVSGGAPLPARTGLLFDAMGMRIVEGYGLTETAPLLAVNRPESYRFGTVGWPVAATEVRIAEETGEVLVRGPQVMAGYLDRPNLTARVLDADGWFHTGDQGSIDPDGRLRITGLLKNLIVLSTGKKAAPAPIERAIGSSPFVRQAVLLGDGQEATGVLIVPDLEALATAAGREADEAAPGRPTGEASRLIATEVERLSAPFGAWERPRRFALLPRPLTAECGELRATGEPDRSAIAAAFPVEVASLFDGRPSLRVSDRHEARGEREDPGAALVAPRGGATSRGRVAG